ncbi:myelocytomatosis oncogene homolog [Xiphophorus hellerii]|uniref:myelocytomatosis oncogene homolog n=1 Tax=Xiphophorus hellerii TaxID=8084 RepID=UPI0013B434F5|nr:transcriptional regulator Myc-2-like [Xiphophorus hellerii]
MLTSLSPDWLNSEPFMFEDVQSLMEMDYPTSPPYYPPTPPRSPPLKPGQAKSLSKEDQLSFMSDILLEDQDLQLLNWTCDLFGSAERDGDPRTPPDEAADDALWRCISEKLDEKLSVLGSSPLLSAIDTSIFEDLVGSTLDCHDLMAAAPEQRQAPDQVAPEVTSDYGSAGGETSTSSSDSEEEIDVESLESVGSSSPSPAAPAARRLNPEEEQRAIQLQHNYAAPRPASPPPSAHKRWRGADGSSRMHHATGSSSSASSSSSSRSSSEDEEERRRTHNVMERQRRNELKNCFLRLRDKVPELSHNDKASKVVILKKARDCIYGLEVESLRLRSRRDRLRAKQEELKARLEQLRR